MDFFGSLFGGLFDFDNDGKIDASESFMAYSIINDTLNEDADKEDYDDIDLDSDDDD